MMKLVYKTSNKYKIQDGKILPSNLSRPRLEDVEKKTTDNSQNKSNN